MTKGCYCLIFRNPDAVIRVGALGLLAFRAGWHVYVGSARGSGGLARVDRHIRLAGRTGGSPHWHVDYLLLDPRFQLRYAVTAETDLDLECAYAGALGGRAVEGFGCSDCRCISHLFHFEDDPLSDVVAAGSSLGIPPGRQSIKNCQGEVSFMKVLGISGSMRREGNTARLVQVILDRCANEGIDTEFVSLAGKTIRPCLGCEHCKKEKICVIEDDDWPVIAEQMIDCEVLVFGSPTYYYDVSGQAKNFIDRTYSLYHDRRLAGRRAVGVAVCADKGCERALQTLEGFFSSHEFSYLGCVKGKGYLAGEVMDDPKAIKQAEKLADKIIRLLRPSD